MPRRLIYDATSPASLGLIVLMVLMGLMGLAVHASAAQPGAESAPVPESQNIDHTRHHFPRNPDHPASHDPSRFFTDRDSPVKLPLPSEENAFFFVVFGDRTGGPAEGVSVLGDAVRDTNLLEPDLVMTVGDLIQGYGETPAWLEEKDEFHAIMDKLICPWFPVAGNHDTYWRNRGGGETKPEGEHDSLYELHFGPLWYSFAHKNSAFIALYTDEGDPETGEKNFRRPESQRMSPEQRAFLQASLERHADADHIFVFVHHPRWLQGGYGDDWDTVHEMLVDAGNVTAVFAGHIHRMRSDPRDGIEYVTLATVGGGQRGTVPDAGYLHQYHVVTVRPEQVAMASIPVGEIMDPRDITGELSNQAGQLAGLAPEIDGRIAVLSNGAADEAFDVVLDNPTNFPMAYTLLPESADARWVFTPDHTHGRLDPGETRTVTMHAGRFSSGIDSGFRPVELVLDRELHTRSFRYAIPTSRTRVPGSLRLTAPERPVFETALRTGPGQVAVLDAGDIELPDGPMTVECWLRARSFSSRVGLIAKTESSDWGMFVSDARPDFSVHVGGRYATARADEPVLRVGQWHHVAGVFDGTETRLYVDGKLVATRLGEGRRRTNDLPFIIGADVNGAGQATSHFDGYIDDVRVSTVARYSDDLFNPIRRLEADDDTVLMLHMDGAVGPYLYDASSRGAHPVLEGAVVERP